MLGLQDCRDTDRISAQKLRRGISSDKLFPSYRRGRDRLCWVGSSGLTGVGAPPPLNCPAPLTSYVTDVFLVEILSQAALVMQLLQPLVSRQPLT